MLVRGTSGKEIKYKKDLLLSIQISSLYHCFSKKLTNQANIFCIETEFF